jgi:hypothetical protein
VGNIKQEDHKPNWPGQKIKKARPYIQNNQSKKGGRHGLKAQSPEFKP